MSLSPAHAAPAAPSPSGKRVRTSSPEGHPAGATTTTTFAVHPYLLPTVTGDDAALLKTPIRVDSPDMKDFVCALLVPKGPRDGFGLVENWEITDALGARIPALKDLGFIICGGDPVNGSIVPRARVEAGLMMHRKPWHTEAEKAACKVAIVNTTLECMGDGEDYPAYCWLPMAACTVNDYLRDIYAEHIEGLLAAGDHVQDLFDVLVAQECVVPV